MSRDADVTYVQSAGNRNVLVPAGSSGQFGIPFPAPESANLVVVFDTDCRELARADVPEHGTFLITITDDAVTVDPLPESGRDFSVPILAAASACL
jgi:hypothetical protein